MFSEQVLMILELVSFLLSLFFLHRCCVLRSAITLRYYNVIIDMLSQRVTIFIVCVGIETVVDVCRLNMWILLRCRIEIPWDNFSWKRSYCSCLMLFCALHKYVHQKHIQACSDDSNLNFERFFMSFCIFWEIRVALYCHETGWSIIMSRAFYQISYWRTAMRVKRVRIMKWFR